MGDFIEESKQKRQTFEPLKEGDLQEAKTPLINYYNSLSDDNLQMLREKNTYEHEPESFKNIEGSLNYRKTKISSMRDAINEFMPGQYDNLQIIQRSINKKDRTKVLHHAVGTKQLKENHDVVQFDIAGSGTYHFRKYHNGYHGNIKTTYTEEQRVKQLGNRLNEGEAGSGFYSYWGRFKHFVKGLFGIKSSPQWIRCKKKSISADTVKENILRFSNSPKDITKNYQDRQKIRYNVAGPLNFMGWFNLGEYSIQNTRQRILDMGKNFLTQRFDQWENDGERADIHTIDLMFKGHSRGGIGSVQGAMMLKRWIHDTYPQYEQHVVFHINQYDPVAGKGSNYGGFEKVNHVIKRNEQDNGEANITIDGQKMRTLGENAQTTVFYSLNIGHTGSLFVPQQVMNAKRVILVPFDHTTHNSLDNADFSQMGKETLKEQQKSYKEKGHEMAFKNSKDGQVYRKTGIDMLENGLYVSDEYGVLVKIEKLDDLYKIMNKVLPKDRDQWDRYRVITKVAANCLNTEWSEDQFQQELNSK